MLPRASRKAYPRFPRIPLLRDGLSQASFADLLARRESVRSFSGEPIAFRALSRVLSTFQILDAERTPERRTYPSAGDRFPIELYLLSFAVTDLEPLGLYHLNIGEGALESLWPLQTDTPPDSLVPEGFVAPGALIVLTAMLQRSAVRYGVNAYPLVLLEAGHVAQNLLVGAVDAGLGACPVASLDDDVVTRAFDLGADEVPIYAVMLGSLPRPT